MIVIFVRVLFMDFVNLKIMLVRYIFVNVFILVDY